jgi:hypothetical protein
MARHELKAAQSTAQPLQRITGIEDLKGVLQGVAAATINRGIDLNVTPRKDQQRGSELLNRGQQNALHIEQRQGRQIQQPLLKCWELLVKVVGQIDRPDRKIGLQGKRTNNRRCRSPWLGAVAWAVIWAVTGSLCAGAGPGR